MTRRVKAERSGGQARMLEAIGLSEGEERAYTLLIEHPGSTVTEVAALLHTVRSRARVVLDSLCRSGLITRTPGKTPRYLPAPPDVAVEALIAQRQRELERVRKTAAQLSRKATKSRRRIEAEVAEVILGAESVAATIEHLQQEAEREIIAVTRAPLSPEAIVNPAASVAALERGARFRVIYERSSLAESSGRQPLARAITAGAEARVFSPIPAPLIIVDGRAGLIPFDLLEPAAGWLLLRASSVLDVFVAYFDAIWDRATPLRITDGDRVDLKDTARAETAEVQELTDLMAAGLRDDVISGHLDVSQRTVDRRVRALMDFLGAETRFQAGWIAAHHAMDKPRQRRRRGKP